MMTDHAPLSREWDRIESELNRLDRGELATILRLMFFFGALTHSKARAVKLVLMNSELRDFEQEQTGA
jgi:hypothetical protein